MAKKTDNICDRCGVDQTFRIGARFEKARLFRHVFKNSMGDDVEMWLCWDCDWDVSNGGDAFEDASDVVADRWENDYEYDPLNTPPPPWRE
jgi:hypothetical protein